MKLIILFLGLLTVLLGTVGAVFLKKASKNISFSNFFNFSLVVAVVAYALSAVPFILALKMTDLSFMYPFTSLHYVTAGLSGAVIFKEKMTKKKIVGMLFLTVGVILVGLGK